MSVWKTIRPNSDLDRQCVSYVPVSTLSIRNLAEDFKEFRSYRSDLVPDGTCFRVLERNRLLTGPEDVPKVCPCREQMNHGNGRTPRRSFL